MNTPKFTPGPWRGHRMESRTIVAGRPGIAVALVDATHRSDEENDANFALCLAAPEMYEALKMALELISESKGWGTYPRMEGSEIYGEASELRIAALAALAKANGGAR